MFKRCSTRLGFIKLEKVVQRRQYEIRLLIYPLKANITLMFPKAAAFVKSIKLFKIVIQFANKERDSEAVGDKNSFI